MTTRIAASKEERALGERMKATIVAICEFLAKYPSSVTDAQSMRLEASSISEYPITSRRQLRALQSHFEATLRGLRKDISLGYWSQAAYEKLVGNLRRDGLIDISSWQDEDAARIQQLVSKGAIRKASDYRLAVEFRDTIADKKLLEALDELIAVSEFKRGGPEVTTSDRLPQSKKSGGASKLSGEELTFLDLLRRSAVAALEHTAKYGDEQVRGKPHLVQRANIWRTWKVETRRDLREMERTFWMLMTKLRMRISDEEFKRLAQGMKERGLIDVSKARKPIGARARWN